jgi:hypothetical protein
MTIAINPFYSIFKPNNWYVDYQTNSITYSDENITLSKVYLNIPFKKDTQYNKKLLEYLDKFFHIIINKNPNHKSYPIKITYMFSVKEETPINIQFSKILNNCMSLTRL